MEGAFRKWLAVKPVVQNPPIPAIHWFVKGFQRVWLHHQGLLARTKLRRLNLNFSVVVDGKWVFLCNNEHDLPNFHLKIIFPSCRLGLRGFLRSSRIQFSQSEIHFPFGRGYIPLFPKNLRNTNHSLPSCCYVFFVNLKHWKSGIDSFILCLWQFTWDSIQADFPYNTQSFTFGCCRRKNWSGPSSSSNLRNGGGHHLPVSTSLSDQRSRSQGEDWSPKCQNHEFATGSFFPQQQIPRTTEKMA